jgi:hypothetical protein
MRSISNGALNASTSLARYFLNSYFFLPYVHRIKSLNFGLLQLPQQSLNNLKRPEFHNETSATQFEENLQNLER